VVGRPTPQLGVPSLVDTWLRPGVERALETEAEWIWVLDGESQPRPGALEALFDGLARVDDGLPAPSLLSGVVRTEDGLVDPNRTPWYRRFQPDVALRSADRGLVPLRGSPGPVLVHRRAAEAEPPRELAAIGPRGVLEWTTRLLRARTGYLVPESESAASGTLGDPLLAPSVAFRLLFGRAVVGPDRVALALELCERVGLR
jgi:hypothetical protein